MIGRVPRDMVEEAQKVSMWTGKGFTNHPLLLHIDIEMEKNCRILSAVNTFISAVRFFLFDVDVVVVYFD